MSSVYTGTGTLLKIGDGASPEVFTTVAQLAKVGDLDFSATVINADTHNQAAINRAKRKIAGMIDGGNLSIEILFDPNEATHKNATGGLLKLMLLGTNVNWQIALPAAISPVAKWTLTGFVSKFNTSHDMDGTLRAAVDITLDGIATLA